MLPYTWRVRLKQALGPVLARTGGPAVSRRLTRRHALILTYHGVLPEAPDSYINRQCVDVGMFSEQLELLTRHYQIVSLSAIVDALTHGKPLPRAAVALTFDDGLRNILTTALPVLRKHNAPATLFLTTGQVGCDTWLWTDEVTALVMGTSGPPVRSPIDGSRRVFSVRTESAREHAAQAIRTLLRRLPTRERQEAIARLRRDTQTATGQNPADAMRHRFLSWDEVRTLSALGVDIEAHGHSHTVLTALDMDAAREEILRSKQEIQRQIGRPCTLFSYPNGTRHDFTARHEALLSELGFRAAVTQIRGVNGRSTPLMALRRINVSRVPSLAYFSAETTLRVG